MFLSTAEWLANLIRCLAYFNSFPHASAQSEAWPLHVPNSKESEEGELMT